MNKLLITGCLLATAFAAVAMPTKKELAAAQKLVEDVIAPDLKALNAGRKTVKDVADIQMKLASDAQSEAEKYLLLQSAFKLYSRGEEFDSAAKALTAINRDIESVPPELIVELIDREFHRGMGQKAPKVLQIFKTAKRTIRFRKELATAERNVKAHPKDPAVNRKLGECYAELGDWNAALAAFVNADGKLVEIAIGERTGKVVAADAGDFWWDYIEGTEMTTYKFHAAELYRTALADSTFAGLARTRAEQRLAEVDAAKDEMPNMSAVCKATTPNVKMINGRVEPLSFNLGKGLSVEFLGCNAGSFEMGYKDYYEGNPKERSFAKPHKVKFSRPFWIGKIQISEEVYRSVMGGKEYTLAQEAAGGRFAACDNVSYDDVMEFSKRLTRRFEGTIPTGYVFRLPTNAEWEYALKSGGKDKTPVFAWRVCDEKTLLKKYALLWDDAFAVFKASQNKEVQARAAEWCGEHPMRSGQKMPNQWGFYDMVGNCGEMVLDVVGWEGNDRINVNHIEKQDNAIQFTAIQFEKNEVDPIDYCDVKPRFHMLRGRDKIRKSVQNDLDIWLRRTDVPRSGIAFRLCLGPDLVSEWKSRQRKGAEAAR